MKNGLNGLEWKGPKMHLDRSLKKLHIYLLTCTKSTDFEKYKLNLKRIKTIPFLCTAKALHNEQFTAIKTSSPFL